MCTRNGIGLRASADHVVVDRIGRHVANHCTMILLSHVALIARAHSTFDISPLHTHSHAAGDRQRNEERVRALSTEFQGAGNMFGDVNCINFPYLGSKLYH